MEESGDANVFKFVRNVDSYVYLVVDYRYHYVCVVWYFV